VDGRPRQAGGNLRRSTVITSSGMLIGVDLSEHQDDGALKPACLHSR